MSKATGQLLARFERIAGTERDPTWIYPMRKSGMSRFAEQGFPTVKDEDWRFTNVAPIAKLPFKPVLSAPGHEVTAERVASFTLGKLEAVRLVFINGFYSAELSGGPVLPEHAIVCSLAQALERHPELVKEHLGQHARAEGNPFAALNSAFFMDGAFVYVPRNVMLETPVHLLFLSVVPESGATAHPRNLVVLEAGSRATVIESYSATVDAAYFTNVVTELVVGENAALEHCKFQDESTGAYHIGTIHATLERSANVIAHSFAHGAKLSRNTIRTVLGGEGVECVLNGLYLTRGDQVADHHMVVEHAQPHCNSHEYYNGILDGRSKGVFHGRILVRQIAQKTDAKQTNKNLLLSEDATVDTKPQLEIYADDVKCTHGATIGQLNEDSIFYLRARGIGTETARRMLIHAFAGEIIERIRNQATREELDKLVWDRLEANPHVAQVTLAGAAK